MRYEMNILRFIAILNLVRSSNATEEKDRNIFNVSELKSVLTISEEAKSNFENKEFKVPERREKNKDLIVNSENKSRVNIKFDSERNPSKDDEKLNSSNAQKKPQRADGSVLDTESSETGGSMGNN